MMGYRDATRVIYCDGCHGVIRDKQPRTPKKRPGQPQLHFHNRRCEQAYRPPAEHRCPECGVRVACPAGFEPTCSNGHVLIDTEQAGIAVLKP